MAKAYLFHNRRTRLHLFLKDLHPVWILRFGVALVRLPMDLSQRLKLFPLLFVRLGFPSPNQTIVVHTLSTSIPCHVVRPRALWDVSRLCRFAINLRGDHFSRRFLNAFNLRKDSVVSVYVALLDGMGFHELFLWVEYVIWLKLKQVCSAVVIYFHLDWVMDWRVAGGDDRLVLRFWDLVVVVGRVVVHLTSLHRLGTLCIKHA